jgi:hypothetical protein
VLEYLHTPHDLPLAPQHQLLMARTKMQEKDFEEGTPDHPGEPLATAEVNGDSSSATETERASVVRSPMPATAGSNGNVVQAAIRESEPAQSQENPTANGKVGSVSDQLAAPAKFPATGTVVLDVEQGGIEVPSFVGKTVRAAVEAAEAAGLELEAVGSGVGRQQSPLAGTHVAAGTNVTVQFGN